jgi:anti-anti-sigma regulatory factor
VISTEESSDGGVVVRVEGAFDGAAASQLAELLGRTDDEAHVVVDFGRVRDVPDHAVAQLARAVAGAAGRVSLVGLGQHQRRILRYFGVGAEERTEEQPG